MEQNKTERMLARLDIIEKGYLELKAKYDKYEAMLKRMQHLQPIWLYQGHVKPEHAAEALALSNLSAEINEVLSAGEGENINNNI